MPQAAARSPVYRGEFGPLQAERLLWRAGFGPRRGQAEALAKKGLNGAVKALVAPGPQRFAGPKPRDEKGRPLAPRDAWGHDHLWWLDRMVRGNRPLVERMTLVWHDWFATSNEGVGSQKLMLRQNALFRRYWLGSFDRLLIAVALIELVNYGEDEHDLVLRRAGGTKTWRLRKLLPGSRATLSVRLRPGTYRLWCAVGDHRARGMRATLRVRR